MNGLAIMLISATLGVDYGWQTTNDGQLEYLIQIEPALVRSIENGEAIVSELPPEVRSIRRFRITVGRQALPRDAIKQTSAEMPADRAARSAQPNLAAPDNDNRVNPSHAAGPNGAGPNGAGQDNAARANPNATTDSRNADGSPRIEQPVRKPTWSEYDRQADAADAAGGRSYSDGRPEPGRFNQGGILGSDPRNVRAEPASTASSPGDRAGDTAADGTSDNAATKPASSNQQSWLIASLIALFASLGANFYQGWNLASARRRYHQLVDRLGMRASEGISVETYGQ